MNRGSCQRPVVLSQRPRASMRPRFMNRGSPVRGRGHHRGPDRASMRPRFMNRGSRNVTLRLIARGMARFNEAPIHESGKCDGHRLSLRWCAALQ